MKILKRITEFSAHLGREYDFDKAAQIRRNCIHSNTIFLFLFCVLEFTIDLDTSTSLILVPGFVLNLASSILVTRFKNIYWIGQFEIFIMFGLFQAHILYNPTSFHTMVYWMPLIPILSFFLISPKASYIWLLMSIVAIVLNAVYGQTVVGESYIAEPRFIAFAIGGSLFVMAIYFAYAFLFSLVGTYYLNLQSKKEEVAELNEQLNNLNINLEKKVMEKVSDIQK